MENLGEFSPPSDVLGLSEMNFSGYKFFSDKGAENLFLATRSLTSYLHDEEIKALILIDRSARPTWIAVNEYWKAVYPEEKIPDIYFINPNGFKLERDVLQKDIIQAKENNSPWANLGKRSFDEIVNDFVDSYKRLVLLHKDDPVLLFDTCIHDGYTLRPILRVFEDVGFSDIRSGVVHTKGRPVLPMSLVTNDGFKFCSCYSFGKDRSVKKSDSSVKSLSNDDIHDVEKSRELRDEIRQIIKDHV